MISTTPTSRCHASALSVARQLVLNNQSNQFSTWQQLSDFESRFSPSLSLSLSPSLAHSPSLTPLAILTHATTLSILFTRGPPKYIKHTHTHTHTYTHTHTHSHTLSLFLSFSLSLFLSLSLSLSLSFSSLSYKYSLL